MPILSTQLFRRTLLLPLALLVLLSDVGPARAESPAQKAKPHVVFVTGDDEYRSEITMPLIAEILAARYNVRTTVLYARPKPQSKQNIEGLEALKDADLAVFFLRYRALPENQLKPLMDYVNSGKPIVGLRTATHSFLYPPGHHHRDLNDSFGRDVFGQKWLYHHGHTSTTDVAIIPEQKDDPILRGIEPRFHVASWLYHVVPLQGDCRPLLEGTAVHSEQKRPESQPVAWTKTQHGGRVFFTTLGHPQDFEVQSVRRLLVNGILWALGRDIPAEGANVELLRPYVPPPTTS